MDVKHILLAGSSGLVGSAFLAQFSKHVGQFKVTCLVRSLPSNAINGVEYCIADFEHLDALNLSNVDAIVCCLGTTIKKAGSASAFRKVDLDFVVNLIHLGEAIGVEAFHVVSAMGANANATILYSKVKGEMQAVLEQSSVPARYVYQPSLLLGDRKEFRLAEKLSMYVMQFIAPLLVGKTQNYKAIHDTEVALAIWYFIKNGKKGYTIVSNKAMIQLVD